MPLIFEHVTYDYAPNETQAKKGHFPQALLDVSLTIDDGAFMGIIGHTGSGKSTLVQHLNGLLQPTSGRVLVDGLDLAKKANRRIVRTHVGIAFQYPEYQLFAETVAQDVAFGPKNLGCTPGEVDRRVHSAIERIGLDYDAVASKSPFELSGGQQRLVALAGILAMEPTTLVLDEPIAGLDPAGRNRIMHILHDLNQQGMTIIMVSHSMEDVAEFATQVLVLDHGQVLMHGTPADVFSHADQLHEIGLGIPRAAKFAHELRQRGFALPEGIYTLGDLADNIAIVLGPQTREQYRALRDNAKTGDRRG
jgi:energy-coupling factor transporter ATPase